LRAKINGPATGRSDGANHGKAIGWGNDPSPIQAPITARDDWDKSQQTPIGTVIKASYSRTTFYGQ